MTTVIIKSNLISTQYVTVTRNSLEVTISFSIFSDAGWLLSMLCRQVLLLLDSPHPRSIKCIQIGEGSCLIKQDVVKENMYGEKDSK